MCDDDELCEGFGTGDGGFSNDNNEMFGCPQNLPRYPFQEAGSDGFLTEKNFSVADSNGHIDHAVEVSLHPALIINCCWSFSLYLLSLIHTTNFVLHFCFACCSKTS